MSASKPLLAFFGPTGGSTLACLILALKSSHTCLALARTPEKLISALLAAGVSQSTISASLHIIKGDILNPADVTRALTLDDNTADIIISGIGTFPTLSTLLFGEVTICRNGVANILDALRRLPPPPSSSTTGRKEKKKPLLVALSTTGIYRNSETRDLPFLMFPLYFCIRVPHHDKVAMEDSIMAEMAKREEAVISGYVMPRPSLLTDGPATEGLVRAGAETKPAVGYTISRQDVGRWVFENCVAREGEGLVGRKVSLTY
ncbi:MAG: hypothetical protein OHK93_004957 [Ramalina farinacea]|uniref:NAD(P)-binding domain-containing protein n=1 Tax=Ramalina farinacea TaxID=258253 RepID=A0AA43TZ68_9LECA|nr:hypothetical protein [Ramalina farinacea]